MESISHHLSLDSKKESMVSVTDMGLVKEVKVEYSMDVVDLSHSW